MTPDELAAKLGVSPKAVRSWLRQTFPRSRAEAHQRWDLGPQEIKAAEDRFRRLTATAQTVPVSLAAADEAIGAVAFEERLNAFSLAPMRTRDEVLASPCPVPREPGIYGWWFRRLPTDLETQACIARDDCTLLYVGISPKRPPASGRPPSTQTLRDRVRYHFTGNAEGSTLRKTLGTLLSDELHLELRRVGSGKRMTFTDGELRLSAWMSENARVSWIVDLAPWVLEARLIASLDVPLNIDGNSHNEFHPSLVAARAGAVAKARLLPIAPNSGVGGR